MSWVPLPIKGGLIDWKAITIPVNGALVFRGPFSSEMLGEMKRQLTLHGMTEATLLIGLGEAYDLEAVDEAAMNAHGWYRRDSQ